MYTNIAVAFKFYILSREYWSEKRENRPFCQNVLVNETFFDINTLFFFTLTQKPADNKPKCRYKKF